MLTADEACTEQYCWILSISDFTIIMDGRHMDLTRKIPIDFQNPIIWNICTKLNKDPVMDDRNMNRTGKK